MGIAVILDIAEENISELKKLSNTIQNKTHREKK